MEAKDSREITLLLQRMQNGDAQAGSELMELVYGELRRLARGYMRGERVNHTLQPTAIVHEVYERIVAGAPVSWNGRSHFFAVAATQMRRVLVDHARERRAEKRGGGGIAVSFQDVDLPSVQRDEDLLSLDLALSELQRNDERAARVVELKYFAGLQDKEIAEALGVSFAAVRRDWEFARAWLAHRLTGTKEKSAGA